jgi:hypothetical protein
MSAPLLPKKRGKNLKNPRLAKVNRLYSTADVMVLYSVAFNTVSNWIKDGLKTARATERLFRGEDLNAFHKARRNKPKLPRSLFEVNCRACKNQHSLVDEMFWIEPLGPATYSVTLKCPESPKAIAWKLVDEADLPELEALLATKSRSEKGD